ncbi:MAG: glycosyltransferase [Gammaproteobacteria bacterium]
MTVTIDVIVRTLADAGRSEILFRALDSIQHQSGVVARPVVVVNGDRYDSATLTALESREGIRLHYLQQASAGRARDVGRSLVTAPYFAFLDDDDVLVKDTLLKPLAWLDDHPQCDVLITNRYVVKDDRQSLEIVHLAEHASQPALSLLDECWLSPGASFFRTESITTDLINDNRSYQEWTVLAFRLCTEGKRIHFMDVPTAIYNDTPDSMSKDMEYHEAALDVLQLIRHESGVHTQIYKRAEQKYWNTLHVLAMSYWKQGQYGRAWRYHLASMRPPHTFKYLLFSRKLLWPFGRYKNKRIKSH